MGMVWPQSNPLVWVYCTQADLLLEKLVGLLTGPSCTLRMWRIQVFAVQCVQCIGPRQSEVQGFVALSSLSDSTMESWGACWKGDHCSICKGLFTSYVSDQRELEGFGKCWHHSPLPLASWILHSLLAVAATNSRDKPSWLVACSVWNVNWQHTAPAPAFSVEKEWVSHSVSDWVSEWVSQGPCLSPSLLLLPNFCHSISHRASLAAAAAVVSH